MILWSDETKLEPFGLKPMYMLITNQIQPDTQVFQDNEPNHQAGMAWLTQSLDFSPMNNDLEITAHQHSPLYIVEFEKFSFEQWKKMQVCVYTFCCLKKLLQK